MDFDWTLKYVVPIIVALSALVAIYVSVWSNFREHAKRLQILDLATKRVAFWDQFLKVVLAATAPDSPEQTSEKSKAYAAILKAKSDALHQTEPLVWSKKIRRHVGLQTFKPPSRNKLLWFGSIFCTLVSLALAITVAVRFMFHLIIQGRAMTTQTVLTVWIFQTVFFTVGGWFFGMPRLRSTRRGPHLQSWTNLTCSNLQNQLVEAGAAALLE